ncbi:hypothetical protein IQ13_0680 [Lacibacter cauensis]|uniref:Uncharacterized protein n=1 Tax=Lacibacter cauensis TaxID=510947 RepID=A0A562SW45_9BACT|nr:hypothetical protein IQ13_0680 [Lacibacter cauensis]
MLLDRWVSASKKRCNSFNSDYLKRGSNEEISIQMSVSLHVCTALLFRSKHANYLLLRNSNCYSAKAEILFVFGVC